MLKPIIFWGATGQAKVLRELVERIGYRLVATFDNNPQTTSPFPDIPLFHGETGFGKWREQSGTAPLAGLAAIGGARGRDRCEIQRFLIEQGIEAVTVMHPSSFVAANASLGKGSQVLAQAAICVEVRTGEACIVNTRASIDHECVLGDGVHIGPGATLSGGVTVGDFTLVGAGAVVLPRIRIGRDAIVGAGAVVTCDVPDGKVVYGNPARIRHDTPVV
ncbi:MAG: acetyltransferase [Verrucomicrobiales bacterium]|nr:acetyltransferase [Verrucomicrobiales bacterium]